MALQFVMKLSKLCNLRCTYCYEFEDLHKKERMPLSGIEFFLKGLAEHYREQPDAPEIRFICHGGEPLLLPAEYLREFRRLQDLYLKPAGLRYTTSLQTNLTRLSDKTLDLLRELNISLGVSFDVFGEQRVNRKGNPMDERVLDNLQRLLDAGVSFGAIVVMHAANRDRALETYRFYNALGINYRILPIFSHIEPPARVAPLMLSHEQALESLKAVAYEHLTQPTQIKVMPISDHLAAAVRHLAGQNVNDYRPTESYEWALIVGTDGAVYNHGDSYLAEGLIGNLFETEFGSLMNGADHRAMDAHRMARASTCQKCSYSGACDQLPVIESIPSERRYDANGQLTCPLARPLIDYCIELIRSNERAGEIIDLARAA